MKVLCVTSTPSHPTTAGNRARVLMMVEAIERLGHELHFGFVDPQGQSDIGEMARCYGSRFHRFVVGQRVYVRDRARRVVRRIGKALGVDAAYRWQLDDFYWPDLDDQLRRLQAREGFGAVLVEYVFLSRALEVFEPGVLKIIDTHDRFSNRHRLYTSSGQRYGWYSVSEQDERRGLLRADVVVAIQDAEAQEFRALLGSGGQVRVATVGQVAGVQETFDVEHRPIGLIVGSSNAANVLGTRAFVQHVLPRVLAAVPDFQLRLVGDVADQIDAGQGIVKVGRVDRIEDAYRSAAISINPVYMGTGLCIKSLETLAFGLPLVSTGSGARGLEELPEGCMLVVGDHDYPGLADAVIGLVRDPGRHRSMVAAARKAAEAWNTKQYASLERIFRDHSYASLSAPVAGGAYTSTGIAR